METMMASWRSESTFLRSSRAWASSASDFLRCSRRAWSLVLMSLVEALSLASVSVRAWASADPGRAGGRGRLASAVLGVRHCCRRGRRGCRRRAAGRRGRRPCHAETAFHGFAHLRLHFFEQRLDDGPFVVARLELRLDAFVHAAGGTAPCGPRRLPPGAALRSAGATGAPCAAVRLGGWRRGWARRVVLGVGMGRCRARGGRPSWRREGSMGDVSMRYVGKRSDCRCLWNVIHDPPGAGRGVAIRIQSGTASVKARIRHGRENC